VSGFLVSLCSQVELQSLETHIRQREEFKSTTLGLFMDTVMFHTLTLYSIVGHMVKLLEKNTIAIKTYIYMDKSVSYENNTAGCNQGDVYVFGI